MVRKVVSHMFLWPSGIDARHVPHKKSANEFIDRFQFGEKNSIIGYIFLCQKNENVTFPLWLLAPI